MRVTLPTTPIVASLRQATAGIVAVGTAARVAGDALALSARPAAPQVDAGIAALPAGPLRQALQAVRTTGDLAAATRALALAATPAEATLALAAASAYAAKPVPARVAERAYRDRLVAYDQALTAANGRAPGTQAYAALDGAIADALYAQRVPNAKASGERDVTTYPTAAAAQAAFEAERAALLDVSAWKAFNNQFTTSTFTQFDASGRPTRRAPQEGDFVKINVGPGLDDWVRIERIRSTDDKLTITVRPSYDPTKRPLTPAVTSHFFTSDATNTFSVEHQGRTVTTRVAGYNERANTGAEAGNPFVALRNKAVDVGSTLGGQWQQWVLFTGGLAKLGARQAAGR